jgi:hypothetical protein
MQETPVLPEDQIEFSRPLSNVPVRENETKYAAALDLEDGRRKDALIAQLYATLAKIGEAPKAIAERAHGRTATQRQRAARALVEKLRRETIKRDGRWIGPGAPATLVNMNPSPLTLTGELQRWTVPSAGHGANLVNLVYKGRQFPASYMTFTTPHIYFTHTSVTMDKQVGADLPVAEPRYIPPIGLVLHFYRHYVEGSQDAQGMGGVLIFEGDIHTLDPETLERSGARIWVPRMDKLEGTAELVYSVEERPLKECLARVLELQKNYADGRIAEGHRFATSAAELERNQLNDEHRRWHNWSLDRGYLDKAYPWAAMRLLESPSTPLVRCPDCYRQQSDPAQFFCPDCNAPFDALKAFLAGKVVSPDRLAVYEGEEFDAIMAEMKRRKAKIALLEGVEDTDDEPRPETAAQKKARERAEKEAAKQQEPQS